MSCQELIKQLNKTTISMIGGAFWGGVAVLGFLGFTGSEVGLSTSAR